MRVLYLAPPARHAGQLSRYSFLDEEIRALAGAGIDAYVLSPEAPADHDTGRIHVRTVAPDSLGERLRTMSFMVRHLPKVPLRNLADPHRAYRAVHFERMAVEVATRERVDLIHSYFGWPLGFGGSIARVAAGVPLVAGLRGADINADAALDYGSRLNASYDRAVRFMLHSADVTLYVSEFLRQRALGLGAKVSRSRVILKGVRADSFRARPDREQVRQELGWSGRPVMLAVAGLVPIKGLNHVLDALALVRDSGDDFFFNICGEGPELQRLQDLAGRLNLADRVKFCGRISRADIPKYFSAADIFVHGALIEASGNAILEAMASALPVVCTDAGGPAEYVQDGQTGYVVAIADPRAMAARLVTLLRSERLRAEMGTRGRRRVEDALRYDRMVEDTIAVYESLVSKTDQSKTVLSAEDALRDPVGDAYVRETSFVAGRQVTGERGRA